METESRESQLQEPPSSNEPQQIYETTGISGDFRNEFATLVSCVFLAEDHPDSAEQALDILRRKMYGQRIILKYKERYHGLSNVITEKNKAAIEKLDGLVEQANKLFLPIINNKQSTALEKISAIKNDLFPIIREMDILVQGPNGQLAA